MVWYSREYCRGVVVFLFLRKMGIGVFFKDFLGRVRWTIDILFGNAFCFLRRRKGDNDYDSFCGDRFLWFRLEMRGLG